VQGGKPTIFSELYSLAVILLWTLLFRNVMLPQVCFNEWDQLLDYKTAYGPCVVFSEHPYDQKNWHPKIGVPLFLKGALSYKSLPESLQKLTEAAFIDGSHKPELRPSAKEWEVALKEVESIMITCENKDCNQKFFPVLFHTTEFSCPFCGTSI
jgi:hypothetical protein